MSDDIDLTQEFNNPDVNFLIILQEMEQDLRLIQLDLTQIKSPIIKGLAQTEYLRLKKEYFYLLAKDLELLKMYQTDNEDKEENIQ